MDLIKKIKHNQSSIKKNDIVIIIDKVSGYVIQTFGAEKPKLCKDYSSRIKNIEYDIPDDIDLLRISHHLLTKKHGAYETKSIVSDELKKRGYSFNNEKNKWFKL